MFWKTITLVTEQLQKYGAPTPIVDVGGSEQPCIADYDLTIKTQDQNARFVTLNQRPFDHIDPTYVVLNPDRGGPPLDQIAEVFRNNFGTAIVSGILERTADPFKFFQDLFHAMKENSIVVVDTAFSYPYEPESNDFWRLSPESLRYLAQRTGFSVLECDWYLDIPAGNGVLKSDNRTPQEVKAAYATLVKGDLSQVQTKPYTLPVRRSPSEVANEIIQSEFKNGASAVVAPQALKIEPTPVATDHNRAVKKSMAVALKVQKRSCVFLDTYYDGFIHSLYTKRPELLSAPYATQHEVLIKSNFGDSDYYSEGLRKNGWSTENLIINCGPLQEAWRRENQAAQNGFELALEQVRRIKPDVVYIQDMHIFGVDFLNALKQHTKLVVGQIASSPRDLPFTSYDVVFSSIIHFVAWFRSLGMVSYFQPLAFEERLFSQLPQLSYSDRPHDVSFVGSLYSDVHLDRFHFLEHLAQRLPIEFWGLGIAQTPPESAMRNKFRGEAWGQEMFEMLSRSKMTVNIHATHTGCGGPMVRDRSENVTRFFANNMRLFEATGCGALLVTDYKENLHELFEVGKEVVAYRSPDECVALIQYYLAHPEEAAKIARAGFERTKRDHTYQLRMDQSAEVLDRLLRYREDSRKSSPVDFQKISYGFAPLAESSVTENLTSAWKSSEIPTRQRALVQQQLLELYQGKVAPPFAALAEALQSIVRTNDSVLEIGCSSGYYYEVLEYLLHRRFQYVGIDYSEAMIEMARSYYPHTTFQVADAADLPFADRSFQVAISSCVLLHLPNYREHIRETARVADRFVVAHRTPVSKKAATQFFTKFAYEVETVELKFNEAELLNEFKQYGFRLTKEVPIDVQMATDSFDITYVFERIS